MKRKEVHNIVQDKRLEILSIQETKLEVMGEFLCGR